MKKSKKMLLSVIGLILVFSLVACGNDNNEDVDTDLPPDGVQDEDDIEDATDGELDTDIDEDELLDDDNDDELDSMDGMIESADYISKIKLIEKGQGNEEIKVLDNIKGDLSQEDLPEIEGMEENKAYLIFLKDDDDNITLIDEEESLILLEGDNHELFEKINKRVHNN